MTFITLCHEVLMLVRAFPHYSEKQEKVTSTRRLTMARSITNTVSINYILSDKQQTTDMQPFVFSSMYALAIIYVSQ